MSKIKVEVSEYIVALLPAGAILYHRVREDNNTTVVQVYAKIHQEESCPLDGSCPTCG
jgi:hypothetical protein